jgi:hypothetical protein
MGGKMAVPASRSAMLITGLMCLGTGTISSQVGTGWNQYFPVKTIHMDDASGLHSFQWTPSHSVDCADYSYDDSTGIETFRIIDSRSNRSEIRLQNNYTSGKRQFEGEVRTSPFTDGQSVMQVFGGATNATALQIRCHNDGNGTLKRYDGETFASGIYGVWTKVNVIHDADANKVTVFINGVSRGTFNDRGNATHYFKYGCYGTLRTASAMTEWRNVRIFSGDASAVLPLTPRPMQTYPPLRCSNVIHAEIVGIASHRFRENIPVSAVLTFFTLKGVLVNQMLHAGQNMPTMRGWNSAQGVYIVKPDQ